MLFESFRRWRRRRALEGARRRVPIDEALWSGTLAQYAFMEELDTQERQRLRDLVHLFLDQKVFAAAHDLQLTPAMQVSVAAQACMLILNLGIEYYAGWRGVILYPARFRPRHTYVDPLGVQHHSDAEHSGEAWPGGPVILSWDDVQYGVRTDGMNVVIHEFAHKLDMLNGTANGYPPLHAGMDRQRWAQVFTHAYEDFCRWVDSGRYTPIDPYASEAPAEFFAVLSETFFERPDILKRIYPDLYQQLTLFYRQDTAARMEAFIAAQGQPNP